MSHTDAIEAVATAVHDLSDHVKEMKAGLVDEDTVVRIAEDVLARQKDAATATSSGGGFAPLDDAANHVLDAFDRLAVKDRIQVLQSLPAREVAARTHRAEGDVRHFQETSDNLVILATALGKDPRDTEYFADSYIPALEAAISTSTVGSGKEYVPTVLSANLIERVNLGLQVLNLFPTVQMPSNPFEITARGVSRIRTGRHTEQTGDTGQTKIKKLTAKTRKVTLTAAKFAGEMITSKEATEDAIIAVLPFMQEELVDFLRGDLEDTALNGCIDGDLDSDTNAADDPRLNWDGLRQLLAAGAKIDGGNAALTNKMLRANRKAMGKYGAASSDLAHIVGIASYINLLEDGNVLTMDKYGPNATILSGELGKIDSIPIVVSEYSRQDLNATGVYDGTTTNRAVSLTVNRRGFMAGDRRGMTIQKLTELYAESDQDAILATLRKAFTARFPDTEKLVAATYNLSV